MTAAFLAAALPLPGASQTIHDGGSPDGMGAVDMWGDLRAAEDFTLGAGAEFNAIRFWGFLSSGSGYTPADIFWALLSDDSGAPGIPIVSGTAAAAATFIGATPLGLDSWQFDLSIDLQSLSSGTFWLALQDAEHFAPDALLWQTSDAFAGTHATEFFGIWDATASGSLAFQLRNTTTHKVTPEPLSLTLLATGLGGLAGAAGARRRRKRRTEAANEQA